MALLALGQFWFGGYLVNYVALGRNGGQNILNTYTRLLISIQIGGPYTHRSNGVPLIW